MAISVLCACGKRFDVPDSDEDDAIKIELRAEEQGGPGQCHTLAAEHRAFRRLPQGRRHGGELARLLALMPGEGAGQRVENQELTRFPHVQWNIIQPQLSSEIR